jgi:hypothetical protein
MILLMTSFKFASSLTFKAGNCALLYTTRSKVVAVEKVSNFSLNLKWATQCSSKHMYHHFDSNLSNVGSLMASSMSCKCYSSHLPYLFIVISVLHVLSTI